MLEIDVDVDMEEKRITTELASNVTRRDTQKLKAVKLVHPDDLIMKIIPDPLYTCAGCAILYNVLVDSYVSLIRNYTSMPFQQNYEDAKRKYRFHYVVNHKTVNKTQVLT